MSEKLKQEYSSYLINKYLNRKKGEHKANGFSGAERRKSGDLRSLECFKPRKDLSWYVPFVALSVFRHFFSIEECEEDAKCKENIIEVYRDLVSDRKIPEVDLLSSSAPKISSDNIEELVRLLPYSFALTFKFTLRKPYISKDDVALYTIDNPVRKEWVYKVPYIAPSQWKGYLRAAMVNRLASWWQNLSEESKSREKDRFVGWRLCLVRLFGNTQEVGIDATDTESYLDQRGGKVAREGCRRGRLMFYPTFFTGLGLEVINPHSRKTGAGKQPIYFETVPKGERGSFSLLYVPFDRAGKDLGETAEEVAEDFCRVAEGVRYLLTKLGFGAKTSSGFGLAEEDVEEGRLAINLPKGERVCDALCWFKTIDNLEENSKKVKALLQKKLQEVGGDA